MADECECCFICSAETGRAGKGDDSLHVWGIGPFCESCWGVLEDHFVAEYRASLGSVEGCTPGPWGFESINRESGHAYTVTPVGACLYVDQQFLPQDANNHTSVEAKANSGLIASAPDMAAEIQKLRGDIDDMKRSTQ